mmetsp:Transcript_6151/g.24603  ORF Transcript_6151/g.24603 Transcript_6151/m.24603 type:complete len:229 (-) Transcript_6151:321-1007(-)
MATTRAAATEQAAAGQAAAGRAAAAAVAATRTVTTAALAPMALPPTVTVATPTRMPVAPTPAGQAPALVGTAAEAAQRRRKGMIIRLQLRRGKEEPRTLAAPRGTAQSPPPLLASMRLLIRAPEGAWLRRRKLGAMAARPRRPTARIQPVAPMELALAKSERLPLPRWGRGKEQRRARLSPRGKVGRRRRRRRRQREWQPQPMAAHRSRMARVPKALQRPLHPPARSP